MRIVPAVLFLAVGISTASAQGAARSTDQERMPDTAVVSRTAVPAASNNATAIAAGAPAGPSPSEPTDFPINGGGVIRAAPPPTPEQEKADAEARAAWQARCRPNVVEDRDGLRRVQYAEPDCDLSRFNTAGTL